MTALTPDQQLHQFRTNRAGYWEHIVTGHLYQTVLLTNLHTQDHDRFPYTVVYQHITTGRVWSRPLSLFLQRMSPYHHPAVPAVTH